MSKTSETLLFSLQRGTDQRAWETLLDVYSPMMQGWMRRQGLPRQDAEDLVQNVLTVVFRKLSSFERQREGSFRSWLRTITVNCVREHWRKQKAAPLVTGNGDGPDFLAELEDPQSHLSQLWNKEHNQRLMQYLMKRVEPEFREKTWQAFQLHALQQKPVEEVAEQLQISSNAVRVAKSKILKRLREQGAGMLD